MVEHKKEKSEVILLLKHNTIKNILSKQNCPSDKNTKANAFTVTVTRSIKQQCKSAFSLKMCIHYFYCLSLCELRVHVPNHIFVGRFKFFWSDF